MANKKAKGRRPVADKVKKRTVGIRDSDWEKIVEIAETNEVTIAQVLVNGALGKPLDTPTSTWDWREKAAA